PHRGMLSPGPGLSGGDPAEHCVGARRVSQVQEPIFGLLSACPVRCTAGIRPAVRTLGPGKDSGSWSALGLLAAGESVGVCAPATSQTSPGAMVCLNRIAEA